MEESGHQPCQQEKTGSLSELSALKIDPDSPVENRPHTSFRLSPVMRISDRRNLLLLFIISNS
jgi:hypothetical protein